MTQAKIVNIAVGQAVPEILTLRLTEPVSAGALLRVRGGNFGAVVALKIDAVRCGDEELPIVHRLTSEEQMANWQFFVETFSIVTCRPDVPLQPGAELTLDIARTPASTVADLTWDVQAGTVPEIHSRKFRCVTDRAGVHFAAGPAVERRVYVKPDGRRIELAFDEFGNPAEDAAIARRGSRPAATGHVQPNAAGQEPRRADEAPPTPVGIGGTPIWFGEIHFHCDFSCDGQRSLASALTAARDGLALDFAGNADHMDCLGRYFSEHTPAEQVDICRRFDEPGRFATVLGVELGGRAGHANLCCADPETFLSVLGRLREELGEPFGEQIDHFHFEELAALFPPGKAIIVAHHPNASSGSVIGPDGRPFFSAMAWPLPPSRHVRLVEIWQSHGSHECEQPDETWRGIGRMLGGSVRTALLRGYRPGFTGATDNHRGWPSLGPDGRPAALTAVQADSLDAASIWDALSRRRCYATTGARIVADAACCGQPIGSEIALAPTDRPEIEIRIRGTAPLAAVQIIHAGAVLADLPVEPGTTDFETTWTDDRPDRPLVECWYYLRARQHDGHCAWLSPFWVDLK